ncbi:MAG: hypothetical protein P4L69_15920, partial [Desulfosporosinus sp.]|nr:hypothetical protein [Desulfosporosinus sp.]
MSLSALAYCLVQILNPEDVFAPYKHLTSWGSVTAQTYVAAFLMLATTLEIFAAGACFLLFCQDRSVRGISFWSANSWYHSAAELGFVLVIQVIFFFDISEKLSYVLRFILRLSILLVLGLYNKYAHYWIDMVACFFAVLETIINGFILLLLTLDRSFDSYANYLVVLLPLSLMICILRPYKVW